jgi:PEP-CTERM motif
MKVSFKTAAAVCALYFSVTAPANAAVTVTIPACNPNDIAPAAQACVGYFQGNILNNNPGNLITQTNALATLGLNWNGVVLQTLAPGGNPANFTMPLNGTTWIGIHYGAGQGPVSVPGGVTALYRFNAGTNLDIFNINPGSISGIRLYATGPVPAVPEPASWMMLIAGFGLIGAAIRRKNLSQPLTA